MLICRKCGQESVEGSHHCSFCGMSMRNICPQCKRENIPSHRYCSECGHVLINTNNHINGKLPVNGRRFSISFVKILIPLLIISLAIIFVYFNYLSPESQAKNCVAKFLNSPKDYSEVSGNTFETVYITDYKMIKMKKEKIYTDINNSYDRFELIYIVEYMEYFNGNGIKGKRTEEKILIIVDNKSGKFGISQIYH